MQARANGMQTREMLTEAGEHGVVRYDSLGRPYDDRRLKPLQSFKPGQSGNARGKRQGDINLIHRLERLLKSGMTWDEFQQIPEGELPLVDVLLKRWVEKACDPRAAYGDAARSQVLDRLLGKNTLTDRQLETQQRQEYTLYVRRPDGESEPLRYMSAEQAEARVRLQGYEKPVAPISTASAPLTQEHPQEAVEPKVLDVDGEEYQITRQVRQVHKSWEYIRVNEIGRRRGYGGGGI
jgi:hypothetical protein